MVPSRYKPLNNTISLSNYKIYIHILLFKTLSLFYRKIELMINALSLRFGIEPNA